MFIGIDVGLKHLDLAASVPVTALPRREANTPEGIASLLPTLSSLAPTLIVLEATGTYHQPLLAALLTANLPVAVINPAQSAAFRQRQLGRHKTDQADARLLARFGELPHAELRRAEPQESDLARLRQLVGCRDDLVAQQTATRNRQHAATWAGSTQVLAWLDADLAQLAERRKQVEREIAVVLATIPDSTVLTTQIGVGMVTAAAVLAYLPAGVHGNAKAAAAYAGVHPRQEQSGQRSRSRLSKQGCPAVRRYLYLAAQCAGTCTWLPSVPCAAIRSCGAGTRGCARGGRRRRVRCARSRTSCCGRREARRVTTNLFTHCLTSPTADKMRYGIDTRS